MQYSIYETITNNNHFPMNAFVISLDSVTWHWHNEYEIVGVLSGSMTMRVQSEEYDLQKGDLILVNEREIHSLQKTSDECVCMLLQISDELFLAGEPSEEKILYFYLNSASDEELACGYSLLFYRMAKIQYETIRNSRVSPFRVRAQVCSLIADMLEFSVYDRRMKNRGDRDQQNMVIELIRFMEKNLMNDDIWGKACREYGVSRKTMDRMTDHVLGISTKELLDNLRVEKAKNLMKYSTKSIGYIMDICGYTSENTFYRSFKKSTGFTPKEYRKGNRTQDEKDELKGYLDYETPKVMTMLKDIIETWENRNYH